MLPDKEVTEGRLRDLNRNDSYMRGGTNLHKDHIVGSHYLLSCIPQTLLIFGRQNDEWEAAFQAEVEAKWEIYAHSPDNWIDAARLNSFTALVRLAVVVHLMSGEMLATVAYRRDDGSPYATAIQMIDVDRLSDPRDRILPFGTMPNVRAGVKFDSYGAPQSYFIRNEHPNDYGATPLTMPKWDEIALRKPWGRLQVIHIFEQIRPDQTRGFTELASALIAMKKSHVLRDTTLQKAIMSATFAAAITSERPPNEIFTALGGGDTSAEKFADVLEAYSDGWLSTAAKYVGNSKANHLNDVKIPRLLPGEKLDIQSAGSPGPVGTEFETSLMRSAAAAFGTSYEEFSRDYTKTNYSSARAGMLGTWKYMQSKKKLIADKFATQVFRLWLEEAINSGKIETAKGIDIYDPVHGSKFGRLNEKFDALSRCEWIGASRGQIDETKETTAALMRIQMGTSTLAEESARLGKDWRQNLRQRAREMQMCKDLGLPPLGIDPAVMAAVAAADASNQNQEQPA